MADKDPYDRWLEEFRGSVDEALSRSQPPTSPVARNAQAAFDNWWRAEQEPVEQSAAGLADENLTLERQDRLLPPDWPVQVERLAYDNAQLERKLAAQSERARELERRLAAHDQERAADAAVHSQQKETLEDAIGRLKIRLAAAEEQARALREGKALIEQSVAPLSAELSRANEQLSLEREKGFLAERQGAALAKKMEELEAERAKLRETISAHQGALEELRRQVSVYQQRLIEAKELTDADVALMRQDLKLFMEELKIVRNTLNKS